jgi:acetamidase/formamidase
MQRPGIGVLAVCCVVLAAGCNARTPEANIGTPAFSPDFVLTKEQTHDKFSRLIEPVVRVPSGSVIEAFTHEATGGQMTPTSTIEDAARMDWDKIHTLTGPVYVEGAAPGDVLAVRLLELEPANWGWMEIHPEFEFLTDEFKRSIAEPQYETDEYYATTGFATTVDVPHMLVTMHMPKHIFTAAGQHR